MIQLSNLDDLQKLHESPNISKVFEGYLADYLKEMLARFKTHDLTGYGSIFVLEDITEAYDYVALGFSKPLDTSDARYFINVALVDQDKTESVTQLIFFSGKYATILFAHDQLFIDYENQITNEVVEP